MDNLVVFDLDGTLIDSLADIRQAVNHVRNAAGLDDISLDMARRCVGNGADLLIDRTIPEEAMEHNRALALFKEYYQKHNTDLTRLYPQTQECLAKLRKAGCVLCTASNKPASACEPLLESFGIRQYFTEVIGGGAGFPLKPEPDVLLFLKEKYPNMNNFMCGDHYTDLECGRRAGFTTILAAYGFGDPREEKADFTAENFSELTEFILNYSGEAEKQFSKHI